MKSKISSLLVATFNAGKVAEIKALLKDTGIDVLYLDSPAIKNKAAEAGYKAPVEDADTFSGNARIKAEFAAQTFHMPVIADDSGLCVDALDGAPGVHTARYGGEALTDTERYEYLLQEMQNESNRKAAFVCVICFAEPEGKDVRFFKGKVEGEIAGAAGGSGGFGYDPVFYYPPVGQSFADMSKEAKNKVSHRGQALAKLVAYLQGDSAA